MKILIISQYWAPENGVPQRRWTWLTRILVDAGHEVTVVAPPPHYQRKISVREWWEKRGKGAHQVERGPAGEVIVRTGFIPAGRSLTQRVLNQATVALGGVWAIARHRGVLRELEPDLIIGTVPALPTAAVTCVASRIFRAPYIIDLRDAWPDLLEESRQWNKGIGKPSLRERVLARGPLQLVASGTEVMLNFALRHAAALILTSSWLENELKTRRNIARRGRPVQSTVVRNVFPPETSYQVQEPRRVTGQELNVLYAGTLGRAQNLRNTIRAAELAAEGGVEVHMRFVGAGDAREELNRLSAESPVDISVTSRYPADALDEHYAWADTALVHLTDWPALKHAVPSKTYELMNVGLHISAVVEGEAADIVQRFSAGDVVPPEDPQSLARLWQELARDRNRLNVSKDGFHWVQHQRDSVAPQRLLAITDEAARR